MSKVSGAKVVRVLLVDDHQIMCDGLRLLLSRQPDMEVAGETGRGRMAFKLTEELRPDLIIMDVNLPDVDGIEQSREILERWPDTRVIILSGKAGRKQLDAAMEAGVQGYLLKLNAAVDLVRAIRAVMRGQTYFSPEVSSVLVASYKGLRESRESAPVLSERERQVLKLIAEGFNTKEIAADMNLSVKTVETHRSRVMAKLGLHSVAGLTKYAIRQGLTSV